MYIDTHAHIYTENYKDIVKILSNATSNNVVKIINCAENLETSFEVLKLYKKYKNLFPAFGIHPEKINNNYYEELQKLEKLIKKHLPVAIGEIGLDFYYIKNNKDVQLFVFKAQLRLAEKYNLPVIIHSRNSLNEVYTILKEFNLKGVIHCFSGDLDIAYKYINLGFKLGYNGIITFKNSVKEQNVLKNINLENVLLETDSPFLTPVPYRKFKNEPKNILLIAKKIANLKNVSEKKVQKITYNNAMKLFKLEEYNEIQ